MSLRRIRLAKRLKSFKRLRLIPRFCYVGISSTFDAVLRYLPIFFAVLRYLSIFSAVLRCSAPPQCPPLHRGSYDIDRMEDEGTCIHSRLWTLFIAIVY